MKVKMRTTSAGPNGVRMAGQVVEVDKDEAKALIDGGYAEVIEEPAQAEEPEETEEEKPKRRK